MSDLALQTRGAVPVVIAGAGPVGLTLAAELAWRGLRCIVVDPQIEVNPHPRAISIGVRSMEHFRRLGLDQRVIDAGVPRNQALDVVYVTRMLGEEIHRFSIPSINALKADAAALAQSIPETTASPYYKTWTAQAPLERMLRAHVEASPLIELRLGWRIETFRQDSGGVDIELVEEASGQGKTVRTQYLAGCDGAKSAVRTGLGIKLTGRGTLGIALGLYFRAPALRAALGRNAGVMYWPLAPGCGGTIYTIDGGDEWVFNRYFKSEEEARQQNPQQLIQAAIGGDIDVEIISALEWLPRQLVAESYGEGRVVLAGDACHLFVPTGGFGMNTGIGDTADLAWKIAAVLQSWGSPALVGTYDSERRPIGTRNTLEAADNYARSGDIFAHAIDIETPGATGAAARRALAEKLPPKIKHFAPIGVHLGYHYEGSPIVVSDATRAPPHDAASYTPTARPGHRAPHFWLREGFSTLDMFGRGFVLLCFGVDGAKGEPMLAAARKTGVPMRLERIDNAAAAQLYERRFVLVRPDGHIAWRSDDMPADASQIIATICGYGRT